MATEDREPWYGTWYGILGLLAVLAAVYLSFRMFLFDWYRTPSMAMAPTLLVDDIFVVSKLAYRESSPRRGDIVVYRAADGVNYVKRVIGLPGDAVVYDSTEKRLTINGVAASVELLGENNSVAGSQLARETIGERSYFVLYLREFRMPGGAYEVPDGHYFVLGDNRDNSQDSRYPGHGFVAREAIIGKVGFIWHLTAAPPVMPTSRPASAVQSQ